MMRVYCVERSDNKWYFRNLDDARNMFASWTLVTPMDETENQAEVYSKSEIFAEAELGRITWIDVQ